MISKLESSLLKVTPIIVPKSKLGVIQIIKLYSIALAFLLGCFTLELRVNEANAPVKMTILDKGTASWV